MLCSPCCCCTGRCAIHTQTQDDARRHTARVVCSRYRRPRNSRTLGWSGGGCLTLVAAQFFAPNAQRRTGNTFFELTHSHSTLWFNVGIFYHVYMCDILSCLLVHNSNCVLYTQNTSTNIVHLCLHIVYDSNNGYTGLLALRIVCFALRVFVYVSMLLFTVLTVHLQSILRDH